jgi:hypothetical protein
MSIRSSVIYPLGALAGVAMLALTLSPASAFTLSGASVQPAAAPQIEKVWWDRWGRWHPNGYAYRRCWRGYYGRLVCN